jgi:hypothetical protein
MPPTDAKTFATAEYDTQSFGILLQAAMLNRIIRSGHFLPYTHCSSTRYRGGASISLLKNIP